MAKENWAGWSRRKAEKLCRSCKAAYDAKRHRDDPRKLMFSNARKRARSSGLPFNIVATDIDIPFKCPVLGIILKISDGKGPGDGSPTLDRIVPALGYTKGNVVVISHKANRMKNDATLPELQALVAWLRKTLRPS